MGPPSGCYRVADGSLFDSLEFFVVTKAKKKPATISGIKGFNRNLVCRDFQFEIGKSYTVKGKVKPCGNGFHACPDTVDPLSVFQFYAPGTSRYCVVDQGGEVIPHEDNKAASGEIFIRHEITVQEIIERAVKFRMAKADEEQASNSGYYGAASNSGARGAAMSHAYSGKVMCEGDGQALYCSEFNDKMKLVSIACGITGRDGIRAGTWYYCLDGKLVEAP